MDQFQDWEVGIVLQGSLDTFGLEDVVTFLATTTKTGRLRLDGDRGTGSLWFDAGDVVAAAAADVPLEADLADVVFELLRYDRGDFAFALGEVTATAGPPHAVAPLLDQARGAIEEWRQLTAVVPSPEHVVALAAELVDDHVTLDREQWRAVLAIGPWTTVAELGDALGEGELPVLRRVCDLVAKGLVEVLDPVDEPAEVPAAVVPEPSPLDDGYRWAAHDEAVGDTVDAPEDAPVAAGPAEPEPIDPALLEQLGGLSPRAAHAVSEVARGGAEDSILMSMLRDEL